MKVYLAQERWSKSMQQSNILYAGIESIDVLFFIILLWLFVSLFGCTLQAPPSPRYSLHGASLKLESSGFAHLAFAKRHIRMHKRHKRHIRMHRMHKAHVHRCLARHFLNLFYKHKIPTNKTSTNSSNDCWKLLASIVLALTTNASTKKWIKFVIWGNYHFSLLLPRTWCMPALKIPRSQNMYILLQLCKNHDLKTKKGPCNPAIGIGAGCTDAVLSAHGSASGLSLSFLLQVGLRQFHHATLSRWSKW